MIKKSIFLIFIFTATLYSNSFIKLTDEQSSIKTTKYNYCKADKESKFTAVGIKNDTNMGLMSKSNLGYIQDPFWCKFEVVNSTSKTKKYILTNPRAGVDYIDVVVFKDDNTTQKHLLGDMVSLENRSYKSVFSNFELELKPNQSAIIVSKYQTVGNLEVSWNIQDIPSFLEYENREC